MKLGSHNGKFVRYKLPTGVCERQVYTYGHDECVYDLNLSRYYERMCHTHRLSKSNIDEMEPKRVMARAIYALADHGLIDFWVFDENGFVAGREKGKYVMPRRYEK